MYPINSAILAKYQNGDKQYARITIGSTVIRSDRIMQGGFNVNRLSETDDTVKIGSCSAAEFTLVLNNRDGAYDDYDFIGKEAYVEVGVEYNNSVSYLPIGYFIFDEAGYDKSALRLASLDRMIKFERTIDPAQLTFPMTVTQLLGRLCTVCGVPLGTFPTLLNGGISIPSLPKDAKTYRDLLVWIAEISGNVAYIDYSGNLMLGWYNGSQFRITPDIRRDGTLERGSILVTGVEIVVNDTTTLQGTNARAIRVENNPLIPAGQESFIATGLFNKVGGFSYTPFSASVLPMPHIFPLDGATYVTASGDETYVPITSWTFTLNGGTKIAGVGNQATYRRGYGLADAILQGVNLADKAVTTDKIADNAVDTAQLAALAVKEGNLAANAVTEGKIAANAVVADKIAAGAISTDKLAALAVTAGNIASGAVTADKIETGAITTDKLAAGAVTADNIAVGAVTSSAIDPSVDMATNAGVASTYATKADASLYEQVIYCRTSTNTQPNPPASWVTESGEVDDTWTRKPLAYNSTYKYLWTCNQKLSANNSLSYTTPVRDSTITVIDGGAIITNSVTADKIDVTDLEAFEATIGGWEIDTDKLTKTVSAINPETQAVGTYIVELRPDETMLRAYSNTASYGGGEVDIKAGGVIEAWGVVKRGTMVASKASYTQDYATVKSNMLYAGQRAKQISGGDGDWHDRYSVYMTESGFSIYSASDPYSASPTKKSELGANELTINGVDMLKYIHGNTTSFATAVPAGADLNTTTYSAVGEYYCGNNADVQAQYHCPTQYAYKMRVENPTSGTLELTGNWQGRNRYLTDITGAQWKQNIQTNGSGVATWGAWYRVLDGTSGTPLYNDQLATRNLANNGTVRQGSLSSSGAETTSTTRVRTGYIGVSANTYYSVSTNTAMQVYEIHEYNGSTFIKYTSINATSGTIKTSSTTTNIRVLMRYSDNRTVVAQDAWALQVEQSEKPSAYVPHQAIGDRVIVPMYSYSDLGTSTSDADFFRAWLIRIALNYNYFAGKVIEGRVQPSGTGAVFGHLYGGVNANYLPNYSGFTYIGVGVMKYFGTTAGTFYLRSVNYTSEV